MRRSSVFLVVLCGIALVSAASCGSTVEQGAQTVRDALTTIINSANEISKMIRAVLFSTTPTQGLQSLVPLSILSLCYDVPKERWISFRVPVPGPQLKVVTNANLPGSTFENPEATWKYTIEYQLLEASTKKLLKSGTYYHITKLTKYQAKDKTVTLEYPGSFYLDQSQVPADGRFFVFNSKGLYDAGKALIVRFRLAAADPELTGVSLRLYNLERTSWLRLDHMWLRTTLRQKEQLAKANVFPPQFLTEEEKRNLVAYLWNPLPPEGIGGIDYRDAKIYVVKDVQSYPVLEPVTADGVLVEKGLRGTMTIPEKGGRFKVVFRPALPKATDHQDNIMLKWYGVDLAERQSWNIPWKGSQTSLERYFQGGLLEAIADFPVTVKQWSLVDGTAVDVTPENLYLRAYLLGKDKPVTYPLTHLDSLPTPVKLDVRSFMDRPQSHPNSIECLFLDKDRSPIFKKNLSFTAVPSCYDRVTIGPEHTLVSDPVSFCFSIPAGVRFVEARSAENVLVAAYTRPPQLPKGTKIPEDYFQDVFFGTLKEPVWFGMRPPDSRDLEREQRSFLIKLQLRPPQDDPDVMAGRFLWDSARPTGDWRGQFILAPEEQTLPYQRDEELLIGFQELSTGSLLRLDIQSDRGLKVVRPTLVFLQSKKETPFSLRIMVDGKPYLDTQFTGGRGMSLLPPLAVGPHAFEIYADKGTQFFMNYVSSKKPDHVLRFANMLNQSGLDVPYEKVSSQDETISMILFSPFGSSARSKIRVKITPGRSDRVGPWAGFTVLDRRFDVRPSQEGPFPAVHAPGENVDSGQRLFFPLHGDLPPGAYRVRVELEEGAGGYLAMSRLLPGSFEERLFREEVILNAGNSIP